MYDNNTSMPATASAAPNNGAAMMGGITGFLGLLQGFTQIQAGRFNSKLDEWNARVAGLQAKDAIRQGENAVHRLQREATDLKGTQRAGYAGQGVVVDQGSAGDVQAQTDLLTDRDVATVRHNAQLTAWGFKVEQADHRMRASAARTEGITNGIGSILTGGARGIARYRGIRYGDE